MTRVLVIGAGHNGLVCATHLAAAGVDVLVLEQAPRPGGATLSSERTLPGFVHDDHAAFVPMTLASPAMNELELGVDWILPEAIMSPPFDDGGAIVLHRDVGATLASLREHAGPGAARGW